MFLQRALKAGLALVLVAGIASLSQSVLSTARAESAQETAIGPDALDALARMGKTPSAKHFSFQSRTLRSYAESNGEMLHTAHMTKTIYNRPDRLSVNVYGGAYPYYGYGALAAGAVAGAAIGAAATAPYYYPQPYYPSHCYPPYPPPYPEGCPY